MDEIVRVNSEEESERVGGRHMVPVFGCKVCGLRFILGNALFEHLEESGHGRNWLKRYRDE